MKKLMIIALAGAAMLSTSCSDFLDPQSEGNPTTTNYFKNDQQAIDAVDELYKPLVEEAMFGREIYWEQGGTCDIVWGRTLSYPTLATLKYTGDESPLRGTFNQFYGEMARANFIIKKLTDKEVQINIHEIKRPELDAEIVAANIARQIENKVAYRRAVKMAIASTMRMGAEGIKVQVSGRLNGAEMARSEMFKEGRTPLHTLRADIDYALVEALTKVGIIGIKVWICRGEVYGKKELAPVYQAGQKEPGGRPRGERKGGFRNKKNNNR